MPYHPPMEPTLTPQDSSAPRKLTHAAAREEQRLYWSQKTIPERLAAATELTKRLYRMRGIDIDERKPDLTVSRVRRSRS